MTDIESLRLLTEAVETAGADIAPTYAEYVQLAFAIATDCGEAGREFFHRLCRISAKYQSAHAERMFSNALTKQQGAIHLGTAFHLAESTGVKICKEARKEVMNNRTGTVGTESSPHNFSTHAHVYNKVEEIKESLIRQAAMPVLWETSVNHMIAGGVDTFVEVGPGKVLSGFTKKIAKGMAALNVEDEASLEKTLAYFKEVR